MRRVVIALLLCSAVLPVAREVDAVPSPVARVDLPAIVLTTPDLEAEGFAGYGIDAAAMFEPANDRRYLLDAQQNDPADVVEGLAGSEGSYFATFNLRTDPADRSSQLVSGLQTGAYLFEDEAAAEAGYSVIADESNLDGAEDLTDSGLGLGDDSEMTLITSSSDYRYGVPVTQLELEIRYGSLVLELSYYDFDQDTAGSPDFDAEVAANVEALGARLIERADAVLDEQTANLQPLAVQLQSSVASIGFVTYSILDQDGIRLLSQTEQRYTDNLTSSLDRGVINSLRVEQILRDVTAAAPEVRLYTLLTQFDTEANAKTSMVDLVDRLKQNPAYTSVELVDSPELGDQASALALEFTSADGAPVALNELFIRIGDTTAGLYVDESPLTEASPLVSVEALEEIGAVEVDCMIAGACAGLAPMPDEIAEMVGETTSGGDSGDNGEATSTPDNSESTSTPEDSEPTPTPEESEATSTSGSGGAHRPPPVSRGETYESPTYGYSVTYDPEVWTISNEDPDPDDPYDQVTFESAYAFVALVGDPDYENAKLSTCVADYRTGLEQSEGVGDVASVSGGKGGGADRAWGTFSYVLDTGSGSSLDVIRFIECRAIDNVTLVILQTSLAGELDSATADREQLMEGLDEG